MNLDKLWKAYKKRGLPAIIALFDIKNRTIELLDPEDVQYITENVVEIYERGLYFDFGDIVYIEGYPVKILAAGYPEVNLLEFLRPAQVEAIREQLLARKQELEEHLAQLEALLRAGVVKEKDLKQLRAQYEQISKLVQYFDQAIQGATLSLEKLGQQIERVKTLGPKFYLHSLYSRLSRYANFNELYAQIGALSNKIFFAIVLVGVLFMVTMFVLYNNYMAPTIKANTQALQALAQAVKALHQANASVAKNATVITVGASLMKTKKG